MTRNRGFRTAPSAIVWIAAVLFGWGLVQIGWTIGSGASGGTVALLAIVDGLVFVVLAAGLVTLRPLAWVLAVGWVGLSTPLAAGVGLYGVGIWPVARVLVGMGAVLVLLAMRGHFRNRFAFERDHGPSVGPKGRFDP